MFKLAGNSKMHVDARPGSYAWPTPKTQPDPSYLIVMTACIDPATGPAKVVRAEPAVRLEDYAKALRYWIDHPDPRLGRVLFLENSGHSLDRLKYEAATNPRGKQIEFISMNCNDFPADTSYGYSELKMLDHGIEQSELARRCQYLIKTTGRLIFPQLPRLLDRLPAEFNFAVDFRDNRWLARVPQQFVTTQLMIFSRRFYDRQIRNLWQEMSPRQLPLIENLLYHELIQFRDKPGAILRWPVNVDPVGQAAHWKKDYRSPRQRLISGVRGVARVAAPRWWV
jgi:hypothetical protein